MKNQLIRSWFWSSTPASTRRMGWAPMAMIVLAVTSFSLPSIADRITPESLSRCETFLLARSPYFFLSPFQESSMSLIGSLMAIRSQDSGTRPSPSKSSVSIASAKSNHRLNAASVLATKRQMSLSRLLYLQERLQEEDVMSYSSQVSILDGVHTGGGFPKPKTGGLPEKLAVGAFCAATASLYLACVPYLSTMPVSLAAGGHVAMGIVTAGAWMFGTQKILKMKEEPATFMDPELEIELRRVTSRLQENAIHHWIHIGLSSQDLFSKEEETAVAEYREKWSPAGQPKGSGTSSDRTSEELDFLSQIDDRGSIQDFGLRFTLLDRLKAYVAKELYPKHLSEHFTLDLFINPLPHHAAVVSIVILDTPPRH